MTKEKVTKKQKKAGEKALEGKLHKDKAKKPDKMERAMHRAVKKGTRKKQRLETCMILCAVSWPKPLEALKYTVFCGTTSAAAGMVVYLYQYGITEIVGEFL